MKQNSVAQSGFFNFRALLGFTLSFVGIALGLFAHFSPLTDHVSLSGATKASGASRYLPVPGNRLETEASSADYPQN